MAQSFFLFEVMFVFSGDSLNKIENSIQSFYEVVESLFYKYYKVSEIDAIEAFYV